MLIRNHLAEPVIVNIRHKDEVIDVNNKSHYSLDGIVVQPKGEITVSIDMDDVIYFANIPMTKIAKYTDFGSVTTIDLWGRSSDIVKCHQLKVNDDVDCSESENIWMKWNLPEHIIFRLYNPSMYFFMLLLIAVLIIFASMVAIVSGRSIAKTIS